MSKKQFRHILLASTAATLLAHLAEGEPSAASDQELVERAVGLARLVVAETYRVVGAELAAERSQPQPEGPAAATPPPLQKRAPRRFVAPA